MTIDQANLQKKNGEPMLAKELKINPAQE